MKVKESMAVNNPTDGPPVIGKQGRLQGAIRSINVRKETNINSPVVFILREGVPFTFNEVKGDPEWYVINDGQGYVMSKYIVEKFGGSS